MAVVQCPNCGEEVVWSSSSPFRPFCSERCKNVDLGAWASERYAISGEPDTGQDGSSGEGDDSR